MGDDSSFRSAGSADVKPSVEKPCRKDSAKPDQSFFLYPQEVDDTIENNESPGGRRLALLTSATLLGEIISQRHTLSFQERKRQPQHPSTHKTGRPASVL